MINVLILGSSSRLKESFLQNNKLNDYNIVECKFSDVSECIDKINDLVSSGITIVLHDKCYSVKSCDDIVTMIQDNNFDFELCGSINSGFNPCSLFINEDIVETSAFVDCGCCIINSGVKIVVDCDMLDSVSVLENFNLKLSLLLNTCLSKKLLVPLLYLSGEYNPLILDFENSCFVDLNISDLNLAIDYFVDLTNDEDLIKKKYWVCPHEIFLQEFKKNMIRSKLRDGRCNLRIKSL